MNTIDISREQLSALADGECSDAQLDVALAALRQGDRKADWDLYHHIGDVLRSDDMDMPLSKGFAERMAARLEAEPVLIAPAAMQAAQLSPQPAAQAEMQKRSGVRRWALPGAIAAAVTASIAFVATPQLMVAMHSGKSANADAPLAVQTVKPAAGEEQAGVIAASASGGTVLRDPRIEDYLLAHQRLSPSLVNSAQYARPAAVAPELAK
ncbi:sigma-E factor negative regulatory protein [Noviherbaspirillum galbum]|uniref:Sigma-E factor negative regulatory protein n=1 Tax=Noviherbaspirillum galbum TaxID=2709383 RepID=A0A6B3SWI9_9BURK|nr:RseA family anti-sigma factor [Noviherbaspirillum galbum]NEX62762.1 sigma-E factor negative regulatory protein [Noviherbaspirillum galbum]